MNTWLHRISHHAEASHPLLDKGFLTIGFSDFCNTAFLQRTQAKEGAFFDQAFADFWGAIPRTRYNLWRFIAEMQVGDRVLIPSWGTFSVYEIESDATLISQVDAQNLQIWNQQTLSVRENGVYIGDKHLDLGFFRKVKVIAKNISRYDYSDAALTSRMKIRSTNARLSDLSASIDKALDGHKRNAPINLHSQILDDTRDSLLKRLRTELTPDKLEALVAWYFKRLGAEVMQTSKNEADKQGDADVIAVFEPLKTIYYIQVKHHTGDTSQWAAQQVVEYKDSKERMDDGYTKIAWVMSTADSFSPECVQLAKKNFVGLFTGPDIARMILEIGIQNLDKAL